MDKDIILLGEAAEKYVTYKYVELFMITGILLVIIGLIAFGIWYMGKH